MDDKVIVQIIQKDNGTYDMLLDGDERNIGCGLVKLLVMLAGCLEQNGRPSEKADEMIQELFDEYKKERNEEHE